MFQEKFSKKKKNKILFIYLFIYLEIFKKSAGPPAIASVPRIWLGPAKHEMFEE
jgi:hypothetical protein